MAKFDLKFLDVFNEDTKHIRAYSEDDNIVIDGHCWGKYFSVYLDKSTAIKFAKTLRTEINKIQDHEIN